MFNPYQQFVVCHPMGSPMPMVGMPQPQWPSMPLFYWPEPVSVSNPLYPTQMRQTPLLNRLPQATPRRAQLGTGILGSEMECPVAERELIKFQSDSVGPNRQVNSPNRMRGQRGLPQKEESQLQNCLQQPLGNLKKEDVSAEQPFRAQKQQDTPKSSRMAESIKIYRKTVYLVRPLGSILISYFNKNPNLKATLSEDSYKAIRDFIDSQSLLKDKRTGKLTIGKFTDSILCFLRRASSQIQSLLKEFMGSDQFMWTIRNNRAFRHWENREQLIAFYRGWVLDNKALLKPTKYYMKVFKKQL